MKNKLPASKPALQANPRWRYKRYVIAGILLASVVLLTLVQIIVAGAHQHGSVLARLYLAYTLTSLPDIIIWVIAAAGALRFKNYAISIGASKDGQALNKIANALLLLLLYIVVLILTSDLATVMAGTSVIRPFVVIANHLPLVVILASSVLLYSGSRQLLSLTTQPAASQRLGWKLVGWSVYVLFAIGFSINFYRAVPELLISGLTPRFIVPRNWLLLSYVLPHLITWLLGLLACVNIARYGRHVSGTIYKQLFKNLYRGVTLVFICIFLTQLLILLPLLEVGLNSGLLLIITVQLLAFYGFVLVYRGASNLQKIESLG